MEVFVRQNEMIGDGEKAQVCLEIIGSWAIAVITVSPRRDTLLFKLSAAELFFFFFFFYLCQVKKSACRETYWSASANKNT